MLYVTAAGDGTVDGLKSFLVAPAMRRPDAGFAVWAKRTADTSPGYWDLLVDHNTGYLRHVQTRVGGKAPAFIDAFGLDEDGGTSTDLGIGGSLYANKKGARGITVRQYSTITHADAYGIYVIQESDLAPAVRIEQNSDVGAPSLQLIAGVTSAATSSLLQVVTPGGAAGRITADLLTLNSAESQKPIDDAVVDNAIVTGQITVDDKAAAEEEHWKLTEGD